MPVLTFSRVAYFDTNIISHLAKNKQLWPKLDEFLVQHGFILGMGIAQLMELSDAPGLYQSLAELLSAVPSGLLKQENTIVDEEVEAYPGRRTETLFHPFTFRNPEELWRDLPDLLSSSKMNDMREFQLRYSRLMPLRHEQVKNNFPPLKTGNYNREQANQFARVLTVQWLHSSYHDFIMGFNDNPAGFHPEVFLSIRLFALVIFYKYYLRRRDPKKVSDFGDLYHLFLIPYCNLVVIERDLCNVLNQIKRNHDILTSTVIHNIDFFADGGWHL